MEGCLHDSQHGRSCAVLDLVLSDVCVCGIHAAALQLVHRHPLGSVLLLQLLLELLLLL